MPMADIAPVSRVTGARAGLVLLYSPLFEKVAPAHVLRDRRATIGRDLACDICIPSAAVSRQHARVELTGGQWTLVDLGGRNGTLVNGAYVTEIVLEHLDEIRIGDAFFKFVVEGAEGYTPYRVDGAVLDPITGAVRAALPEGRAVGGHQIRHVAASLREIAKSNLAVMILGESGTGKEVFAQQLHDWSGRTGPIKAINCAAIPAALLEGELFGHKRGAFSGADRDRVGLVRAAHGGTLFLDEIGDLPHEAQATLLRVIQTKEVTPLGTTQAEPVDVRFVCATHRNLSKLQQEGKFRGDLFARLNEHSVTLPPLRARKEDLFMLCQALAARHGRPDVDVTVAFMAGLLHHDFPYNVRELEALIKRWAAISTGPVLDVAHWSAEIQERMATYGQTQAVAQPPSAVPEAPAPPVAGRGSAAARPAPALALPPRSAPGEEELRARLAEHRGNVAALSRLYGKDRVRSTGGCADTASTSMTTGDRTAAQTGTLAATQTGTQTGTQTAAKTGTLAATQTDTLAATLTGTLRPGLTGSCARALAAAVALFGAGCGDKGPYIGPVDSGPRDPASLTINGVAEPQHLDPARAGDNLSSQLIHALFEGLTTPHPRDMHPVQGVAERWERSDDGRVYRFHLRADARWSDGRPVVSGDFVAAWRRLIRPATAAPAAPDLYPVKNAQRINEGLLRVALRDLDARPLTGGAPGQHITKGEPLLVTGPAEDGSPGVMIARFRDLPTFGRDPGSGAGNEPPIGVVDAADLGPGDAMLGVRATSDLTLDVELARPTPYFLDLTSRASLVPVREDVVQRFAGSADEERWTRPENLVSNGPFVLEEWLFRYSITMRPNPMFWARDGVRLGRVTWLQIDSAFTAMSLYKTGELDVLGSSVGIPIRNLASIEGKRDVLKFPMLAAYWYEINARPRRSTISG
ncbi:MAG: sigma 54-interacting transcriptional regulator [Polyangiaceae bacterium]